MASSVLGCVCRKAAARSSGWISRKAAAIISTAGSLNNFGVCRCRVAGISTLSDLVSDHDGSLNNSPSTLPSRTSPWLMLPPSFEGSSRNMVYNFYSLAENRVLSFNKRASAGAGAGDDVPADGSEIIGSSHGWLALYNPENLDLFLSNPLTGRHIKLPSIRTLPIPKPNLDYPCGCVSKMIISSSSPDEDEECRAILTYDTNDKLAFCCPGRSTHWTPFNDNFNYEQCVYSARHKLFFCATFRLKFEAWNLLDPSSPRCTPMDIYVDDDNFPYPARSEEERLLKESCEHHKFLVVADPNSTADLLLVRRFVLEEVAPDGSDARIDINQYTSFTADGTSYPYKTIGFDVHKVVDDGEETELKYMDGSLDGLAIFIGSNHSFALRASDFPELKPNSIYYTDFRPLIIKGSMDDNCKFGGHDLGIYNYEDRTFSPCYYPCDVQSIQRIEPAPMWFTPSLPPLN